MRFSLFITVLLDDVRLTLNGFKTGQRGNLLSQVVEVEERMVNIMKHLDSIDIHQHNVTFCVTLQYTFLLHFSVV